MRLQCGKPNFTFSLCDAGSVVVVSLALIINAILSFPALGNEGGGSLVQSYRKAHEAGDVQALMELVWWEGAMERTREKIEEKLKRYLGYSIKEIKIRPLSGDENFNSGGYRPNLKPVGWLAITFESSLTEDSRFLGQVFVVGEKEGKSLITVAVPKP